MKYDRHQESIVRSFSMGARAARRALLIIAIMGVTTSGPAARAQPEAARAGDDGVEAEVELARSNISQPWVEGIPRATRIEANRIFLAGNALMREGLFARATEKYHEALGLWDHPRFHFNLAIAQLNLGQPIAAHDSLQRAVRYGDAPFGRDKLEQAQSFLALLQSQLAELEVVCDQAGAQVSLDGKPLFVGPGRRRSVVEPGGHQIVASGEGRIPATEQVVLAPGGRAHVAIAPLYLRVRAQRRWARWKPWTVVGAGAAVALLGGALQWNAGRALGVFERGLGNLGCADENPADGSARRDCGTVDLGDADSASWRSATWQQRAAITSYALGGAAVVTGAVLLVLNRAQSVREYVDEPQAWLMVAPDQVGVAARLRF